MKIPWLEHTFYKVQSGWRTSSPSFGKDHELEGESEEFETYSRHKET